MYIPRKWNNETTYLNSNLILWKYVYFIQRRNDNAHWILKNIRENYFIIIFWFLCIYRNFGSLHWGWNMQILIILFYLPCSLCGVVQHQIMFRKCCHVPLFVTDITNFAIPHILPRTNDKSHAWRILRNKIFFLTIAWTCHIRIGSIAKVLPSRSNDWNYGREVNDSSKVSYD